MSAPDASDGILCRNARSDGFRKLSEEFRGVLTTREIVMHRNFRRKRLFTHEFSFYHQICDYETPLL